MLIKTEGEITYGDNLDGLDWQEIDALFVKAGLGGRDPAKYPEACRRSYACVVAQVDGHTIGMGRLVSDGYVAHAIFDVAVLPEYQGRGIGRRIMELLHEKLSSPKCLIYAAPGKEGFYAKLGYYPCKTGMLRVGDVERAAKARKAGYI